MNAPTNGVAATSVRPAESIAPASGTSVLSLDPKKCHPAPGNRTPTMELVAPRLLPSIADIGQQVPGIVCDHRTKPGEFEILAGNLRCFCCSILNIPFKAQRISGDISESALIKLRVTENEVREAMSLFELADDLLRFQQLEGCTQAQLAERLHLSEALISRTLRTSKNMAPDLRPLVENFTIKPSVAFQIASLPTHDIQRQATEQVIQSDMKRDAVAALVARLKGKKSKKPRPVKGKTAGGLSWCFTGTPEAMLAEAERLSKALKTLIANKWDLSLLSSVLKG